MTPLDRDPGGAWRTPIRAEESVLAVWLGGLENRDRPKAADTPTRHSAAGGCARAMGLEFAGFAPTDPWPIASLLAALRGEVFHEIAQAALKERWGDDVTLEAVSVLPGVTSGHADALIRLRRPNMAIPRLILWELKTVSAWKFAHATGLEKRGPVSRVKDNPPGPSIDHVIQASLNALALEVDRAVISYLLLDPVGVSAARAAGLSDLDRCMAEWEFGPEVFRPVARAEMARMVGIHQSVKAGILPQGSAPGDDGELEFFNPNDNRSWRCDYCSYESLCKRLAPCDVDLKGVR